MMTIQEAMQQRHSVRSYIDQKIDETAASQLQKKIDACNQESGLHIQMVLHEPQAFDGFMAHYGKFTGVQNYIALIGKKSSSLEEQAGYYGEQLVLTAQQLGLNTCWVAMTVSKGTVKKHCVMKNDEKIACVIALGYGTVQGAAHSSKPMSELCQVEGTMPAWFKDGMEAVMLAPTAVNQQKFLFTLQGEQVTAKSLGGFYSMIDLGIVKYHFEAVTGRKVL